MDAVVHHDPSQNTLSPVSRKRTTRENETPAQRQKREKAAERQRRKRERDRHVNTLNAAMSYTEVPPAPPTQPPPPPPPGFASQEPSPEEVARKERVRAAARERQRKHRTLAKQRKMRELGLDMTSEMLPAEEVQFHVGQGEYRVLPMNASFPHPPLTGGQSLASSMMLSLSFQEALKEQQMRSLSLTTEDLVALQAIFAEAFDQWDHQRRMHFAQQQEAAAKAASDGSIAGPSGPPPPPFPDMNDPTTTGGFVEQPEEFRANISARFQRSTAVPSPFRTFNAESTSATTSTPTSTPGSGPPSDPIDPHLSGVVIATEGPCTRPKPASVPDSDTDVEIVGP